MKVTTLDISETQASTECNFEVGENKYGVCKTCNGQTPMMDKIGKTPGRRLCLGDIRHISVIDP